MPDTQKLIHAIHDYTGDLESLNQFTAIMQEQLGDNWVSVIYEVCPNLEEDDKERLDHAVGYHSATLAWEEIHGYLNQANQLDVDLMQKRLPVLEHWLNFFGPEGMQVVKALKERLQAEAPSEENNSMPLPQEENNPPEQVQQKTEPKKTMADIPVMVETENSVSATESSFPPMQSEESVPKKDKLTSDQKVVDPPPQQEQTQQILPEQPQQPSVPPQATQPTLSGEQAHLWLADKIFLQINLMNQVHDWVAARCHTLGNLELDEYAFKGFLTDLQRQTLADIQVILADTNLHPFLEQRQQGAVNYLKQQCDFLMKTVAQSTSPAPLTKEDLTREEMQRTLGGIDTRNVKEYLGPAPDGFEVVNETFTEEEAKTIKENYEQAEAKIEASTSEAELNPDKALEQNSEKKGLRNMVLNMKPGDAA